MNKKLNDLKHEPCDHFGGCPRCGQSDGCMNIGQDHWFVCDAHKRKWCVGSNLFSYWREESDAIWKENADKLAGYVDVRPRYFQTAFGELRQEELREGELRRWRRERKREIEEEGLKFEELLIAIQREEQLGGAA